MIQRTLFSKLVQHVYKARFSTLASDAPIHFNYQGSVCKVLLNRPKAMNSLNLEMVRTLRSELERWNGDPSLKAIIFKGAGGKAFCSGADMIRIYNSRFNTPPNNYQEIFFNEEFTLHCLVGEMKPTQICFWDGIVMGGGAGLSVHAPIRIATENSVFAMPEARVGVFTDASGGHFLSRLKNHLGYFLGLTATHLKAEELVQVGIADFFVKRENLEKLENDITYSTNPKTTLENLREIVRKYETVIDKKYPNEELINELFSKKSVEDIFNAIKDSEGNKEFTQELLNKMNALAPVSLRVIFEQLNRGKEISLRENLKMDMRLMMRFLNSPEPYEGIRCLLVDRGSKPIWTHSSISDVTQRDVERYFEKLEAHREIL